MATLRDLMQEFVNKDYSELVGLAKAAARDVLPACAEIDEDGNGRDLLLFVMITAIGADGDLSEQEYAFLKDMGYTYEEVKGALGAYSSDMVNMVKSFFEFHEGSEIAESLYIVILCAASCDGTIKVDEIRYLEEMFEAF